MVTMSKEYMREYYRTHKEIYSTRYNTTVFCEYCSSTFQSRNRKRHEGTLKHRNAVATPQTCTTDAIETLREHIKAAIRNLNELERQGVGRKKSLE